jgi:hypothetical protein
MKCKSIVDTSPRETILLPLDQSAFDYSPENSLKIVVM